ncbi:hypothetical protein S40288_07258 [Stachybotrys chartarum IBT 40288]|nr:hypothetical protein S40288_07258 [Stachybotrys chartarum IBT 40288]
MEIQFAIPIVSSARGNPADLQAGAPTDLHSTQELGTHDAAQHAPALAALPASKPDHMQTAADALATPKLIHTKRAPLVLAEPSYNSVRFANSDQRAYFDEWTALSVTFLSGGLNQARLWTATMPQLTLDEPTLRYGAMAVGALRKAYEVEHSNPNALTSGNRHYLNAVMYYCEALRLQSLAKPTKEGTRTALLSSLLFICFEAQQGNTAAAMKHIMGGFSMLNELAACTDKAPGLVSIAPAPPSLVQEILDCYRPLELQSRTFMGSPRNPKPPATNQTPPPLAGHELRTTGSPAQSPSSQPGTPWQIGPPRPIELANYPSPTSAGSPRSQDGHPSPPSPPARPPGIAPFTKSSPYFRPRISTISTLNDLPNAFQSFGEAQGYWTLIQRHMVHYLPLLTMITIQLNLPTTTSDVELEKKFASMKQHPKINKFIAESRYWLQRWIEAFDPLFQAATRNAQNAKQAYLHAVSLRIEYLILYIYTTIPRFSGLITAKGLTPQYREINAHAETLLASLPRCGFSMDSGWIWPLFISSFACRDHAVREDAIRILGEYPIRNALRDSRIFRAVAMKNRDVELLNSTEGDENEQWIRLRRRELVFGDLGNNVAFRSTWKNPNTGKWELIEEVADIRLGEDGRLEWRQQPVSGSVSLLAGVC